MHAELLNSLSLMDRFGCIWADAVCSDFSSTLHAPIIGIEGKVSAVAFIKTFLSK